MTHHHNQISIDRRGICCQERGGCLLLICSRVGVEEAYGDLQISCGTQAIANLLQVGLFVQLTQRLELLIDNW